MQPPYVLYYNTYTRIKQAKFYCELVDNMVP